MKKQSNFPQVLFLGNGLNRAYGANDWGELLKHIHMEILNLENQECHMFRGIITNLN